MKNMKKALLLANVSKSKEEQTSIEINLNQSKAATIRIMRLQVVVFLREVE